MQTKIETYEKEIDVMAQKQSQTNRELAQKIEENQEVKVQVTAMEELTVSLTN